MIRRAAATRLLAVVTVAAALVLTSGCATIDRVREVVRDGYGPVTYEVDGYGEDWQSPDFSGLEAGDCFRDPWIEETGTGEVEIVDCDRSHDNEVFALVSPLSEGGGYPGYSPVWKTGTVGCLEEFAAYVGSDYIESDYDFAFEVPDAYAWDDGMRHVVCYLYATDYEVQGASARDSGR